MIWWIVAGLAGVLTALVGYALARISADADRRLVEMRDREALEGRPLSERIRLVTEPDEDE